MYVCMYVYTMCIYIYKGYAYTYIYIYSIYTYTHTFRYLDMTICSSHRNCLSLSRVRPLSAMEMLRGFQKPRRERFRVWALGSDLSFDRVWILESRVLWNQIGFCNIVCSGRL